MKRASIYLRVSTQNQDYERQRNEIIAYCNANQYEIVKVFEEKISGAKDDRPQFNELCSLEKKDVDCIIVWEISRLGRKLTTVIKAVEDFKDKGINVISLKEHFELFERDGKVSPSSMIMMSLFSTMAVIERENIMERSKSGKINKMKDGTLIYTDTAPYGYRIVDKKLVICQEEAEIVRSIYNEYINGFSQTQIAKAHNMHQSAVHRILSNPVYCGRPFSKLLKKTLQSPQIVSVDTYTIAREKCAQRTLKRAKMGTVKYPLRCKMYCEVCNHVLSKVGESFSCHCRKTSIQTKFVFNSNEMILDAVKKERESSADVVSMNEKMKSLEERNVMVKKVLSATNAQLTDARAKVEVLKDIFSLDKLKKEVAEVKRLESDMDGYYKDLVHIRMDKKKLEMAMDMNVEMLFIDDIVEKVVIHTIDRTSKSLDYHLVDGTQYTITIRTRKNEYEIKKG